MSADATKRRLLCEPGLGGSAQSDIDVIFAPYESYLDDVLGVIRNEPVSAKLSFEFRTF